MAIRPTGFIFAFLLSAYCVSFSAGQGFIPTTLPTTIVPTATTSTTTASPTTDTTRAPMAPPNPPRVQTGKWNVTEFNKTEPCLMANFGLLLYVPYATTGDMVFNGTVAVPPNAISNGTCNSLVLSWPSSVTNASIPDNFLTMTFAREYPLNNTNQTAVFRPATITAMLAVDPERFPGAVKRTGFQMTVDHPYIMSAPINNSYRCDSEWMVPANSTTPPPVHVGDRNATGFFSFKNVQIQPYMPLTPGHRFSTPVTCSADRTGGTASKVVPIAVGCALGGLVIVVIFAYILGRRRSRQRGYGSV